MDRWRSRNESQDTAPILRNCPGWEDSLSTRPFLTLLAYAESPRENGNWNETYASQLILAHSVAFRRSFTTFFVTVCHVSFSFFYIRSYFYNIPLICHKYHSRVFVILNASRCMYIIIFVLFIYIYMYIKVYSITREYYLCVQKNRNSF